MIRLRTNPFRKIPDFPDYRAARDGRIWSEKSGQFLKPWAAGAGYRMVTLCCDGRQARAYVHRLIAEAFIGPAPFPGAFVCHNDDDPTNNRAENLRWDTPAGNSADMLAKGRQSKGKRHGELVSRGAARGDRHYSRARPETVRRGVKHPKARLNDDDVRAIRADGRTLKLIGADYGVHPAYVSLIKSRKRWAHVTDEISGPSRVKSNIESLRRGIAFGAAHAD